LLIHFKQKGSLESQRGWENQMNRSAFAYFGINHDLTTNGFHRAFHNIHTHATSGNIGDFVRTVESIGGQVMVDTEIGKGTSIHLVLPSSLALKAALLFEVDQQTYAIALSYIDSVGYFRKQDLHKVSNGWMVDFKGESILVVFLSEMLSLSMHGNLEAERFTFEHIIALSEEDEISLVVASHSGRKLGIVVDKLVRQKEIIEKKLPRPLDRIKMLSGSTILGSGEVCPVLDVAAVMDMLFHRKTQSS
jgi:two-component system chemotaxis sensor kinase CheA